MDQVCVAIDLETTGTDPRRDRIIEVGAVRFQGSREIERISTFVDPGREVPAEITALTGIATADLKGAPSPAEAVARLRSFVGAEPIVGQHLAFDLAFLEGQGLTFTNPVFDTFELGRLLWPTLRSHSLASLARHCGVATKPAHRALPDAQRARDVLLALCKRARELHPLVRQTLTKALTAARVTEGYFFLALDAEAAPEQRDSPARAWPWEGRTIAGSGSPPAVQGISPPAAESVAAMLRDGGPLARTVPQFERRAQQEAMARAVAEALTESQHLIVEAGTGTGKSLAYLLPAALLALSQGERVVISTNTINLQEQLLSKDIPGLQRALAQVGLPPGALRVRSLKGRANYLCPQRLLTLLGSPSIGPEEARLAARLLIWMSDGGSGDYADLPLRQAELNLWSSLSAQSGNCAGQCPPRLRSACPLQFSRQEAQSCHLVVVNHALLLTDMLGGSQALPDHDYLILDEAQHLEDQATEQLSFRVSPRTLGQVLDGLGPQLTPELAQHLRGGAGTQATRSLLDGGNSDLALRVDALRSQAHDFFSILGAFLEEHAEREGDYERRLRLTSGARAQPQWAEVEQAWVSLSLHYRAVEDSLASLLRLLEPLEDSDVLDYEGLLARLSTAASALAEQRQRLEGAIVNPEPQLVYWASLSLQGDTAIAGAPLEVAPVLKKHIFDEKRSVVLTSATLSTEGTFEYIKGRLGLDGPRELLLDSPFDYYAAALLCLPRDMAEPSARGYQDALAQAIASVAGAAQGRTLALFTSYASLRAAHEALDPLLRLQGIAVLAQGVHGTPAQLLDRFTEGPPAVLLGTSSFWEGVDVAGEALSAVVVVRLPFAVPTDPVFAARSELCDDPFNSYALPQAVLRFKQGFGRLIRRKTDRGVVVVLDRRILSRSYGRAFRQSVPPCSEANPPLSELGDTVRKWLHGSR
jgi:DNA polymerase-3 subunit epsilon/ATP-dependent DNA helicase DinG